MPVKRKPDQSIIEALNKAQHIAFGPVLFQAVRSALATGLLSHISEAHTRGLRFEGLYQADKGSPMLRLSWGSHYQSVRLMAL